ncbi:MAG: hypothetical protein QUS66_02700 [Bacteroidota bacterium]|nr:hypothetical protein [Bacteroidota bacterium]
MKWIPGRRATFGAIILALLSGPLLCQEESQSIKESVEEILALSEDADPAALLEELEDLKTSPVNINSGDEKEISRLFFLTEFQVMVLADHVRKNGSVVTLYELALLPAFDRNTVLLMAPYVSLEPMALKGGKSYSRSLVTLTLSSRFSGTGTGTEGVRSLLKMKHEQGSFSFGFTAENDPGESFSFKTAPGTDFLSGYIEYQGNGIIKRIIAGDYAVRAGEGILLSSSQWMGSWLSSPSFMSGRSTAAPYTSTEENSFFRGLSLTIGNMNAGAVLFASANKIDARILYDEDSSVIGVINLVSGGIHITKSQLEACNSLTETVAGIRLSACAEKVRGGLTAAATWFSLPFEPDMTQPENLHSFEGDRLFNVAADIRAGTGSVLFFAEAGMSFSGHPAGTDRLNPGDSWAATAGLRAKPSGRVTFNSLIRHFAPGYHAFHSGAFKAGSGSGNETGLSASVHLEAARHLFITLAADHYRIPAPRYRSSSSSVGNRIELKGEYQPRDNISLRLTCTSSSREYDAAAESGAPSSETHTRQQLGLVFDISPSGTLRLTTRASASFITPSQENGYLLSQDFSYSFRAIPLKLWFRYALCSTGGWDSRLYAWENDLLSSFSIPALYGEMTRSFIMLSWKPADRVEVRVKYGFTDSANNPGGGLRQEFKGQVRIGF